MEVRAGGALLKSLFGRLRSKPQAVLIHIRLLWNGRQRQTNAGPTVSV